MGMDLNSMHPSGMEVRAIVQASVLYQIRQAKEGKPHRRALLGKVLGQLQDRHAPTYDAFCGFQFPTTLPEDIKDLALGIPYLPLDWHKGLGPGVAMFRSAQAENTLLAAHDFVTAHGASVTMADQKTLKHVTPQPPPTWADFKAFVSRYCHILLATLYADSHLYQAVQLVRTCCLDKARRSTQGTPSWFPERLPHIIWGLCHMAQDFFATQRLPQDFPTPGCVIVGFHPRGYDYSQANELVSLTTYPIGDLPPQLARLVPPANPLVGMFPTGPPGGQRQQPPAGPGRARDRQTATGNGSGSGTQGVVLNPRVNTKLNQLFQDIQACQIAPYYKTTNAVLRESKLKREQALQLIGLPAESCFNYYVRGACQRHNCQGHDSTVTIPDDGASALYNTIRPTVQNYKDNASQYQKAPAVKRKRGQDNSN